VNPPGPRVLGPGASGPVSGRAGVSPGSRSSQGFDISVQPRTSLGLPPVCGLRSLAPVPIRVGEPLSLEDVVEVASGAEVELGSGALGRIGAARDVIERAVASNATVYGVTTGFGSLANERIEPEQADALQLGIVRSHATAVGRPLSREEARAMLLLRAHVLALGHSGVRAEVVERMVEMLNRDLVPVVPEQGSLGASGDLAPLANLALPLVGRGELLVDGEPKPAAEVMRSAGLEPLELKAKEGLALVNGTQGMLAIGILAVSRAERLVRTADVTAAMSVEAALGSDRVFDGRLTVLRPHPGVVASASNLRRLLEGSAIVASHRDSTHLVQDAYSLRCSPQVNGATREVLGFVRGVLEVEANAVSDNPIVLPDDDEVLSGGNFHGQPVAVALDALAAALVPLASIAERRLYRLLDPTRNNGLPAFLVADSGLNSGFMLVQYTAASLVSECKTLAHPASVDSIGSSAGQEDHVSMGMTAARHAREVVSNAEVVIALEALVAAQALDLRAPLEPAAATGAARDAIRARVSFLDADRELGSDIAAVTDLVRDGTLLESAERPLSPLD
jgi:histidine ammonia-lyase